VPYGVGCQPADLRLALGQPLSLTTARYPAVGYCPPGDPGHTVNVTPVEPSLRSVLNGHLTGASR
jgi:hypothetical protein